MVEPGLMERARRAFPNATERVGSVYGLTEAGGILTAASGRDIAEHPGCVGKPLPVVELLIDAPNADGIGEVIARSPSMMSGYWSDDSPSGLDEHGWLRTGDLGRLDPDGFLYITGRSKDIIVRGG
jgi:long-chain acyl-CoA synthetase